jgi:outer membrane immunogenic protein
VRSFVSITIAAIGIAGTSVALADGMPERRGAPVYVERGCHTNERFKGAYIGAAIGVADWRTDRTDINNFGGFGVLTGNNTYTNDDERFTVGATVGYNMVNCNTLFGVEADWSWVDGRKGQSENLAPGGLLGSRQVDSKMDWLSTVRGRAGIINHNLLLYVTSGLAFANIDTTFRRVLPQANVNESFSYGDTRWGWTIGAGAELAVTDSISVKSEALYVHFEDDSGSYRSLVPVGNPGAFNFHSTDDVWLIRTGINIKLNREERYTPMK